MTRAERRRHRAGNLGQTGLKRRRRNADPMQDYDALAPDLRHWLQQAVLPWSPQSCKRIWQKIRADGASCTEALAHMDQIEAATLNRAAGDRV